MIQWVLERDWGIPVTVYIGQYEMDFRIDDPEHKGMYDQILAITQGWA